MGTQNLTIRTIPSVVAILTALILVHPVSTRVLRLQPPNSSSEPRSNDQPTTSPSNLRNSSVPYLGNSNVSGIPTRRSNETKNDSEGVLAIFHSSNNDTDVSPTARTTGLPTRDNSSEQISLQAETILSKEAETPELTLGEHTTVLGLTRAHQAGTTSGDSVVSTGCRCSQCRPVRGVRPDTDESNQSRGVLLNVRQTSHKRSRAETGANITESLHQLLKEIQTIRNSTNTTMDIACQGFQTDDLPEGVATCGEYAQQQGLRGLDSICNGSLTEVHRTGKHAETMINTVRVMDDLKQLLKAVSQLYHEIYPDHTDCMRYNIMSISHMRCSHEFAEQSLHHAQSIASYLLTHSGVTEAPNASRLSCKPDLSNQRKFPLGPLWRIQRDLDQVSDNLKNLL